MAIVIFTHLNIRSLFDGVQSHRIGQSAGEFTIISRTISVPCLSMRQTREAYGGSEYWVETNFWSIPATVNRTANSVS